jgi:hypothetical protein
MLSQSLARQFHGSAFIFCATANPSNAFGFDTAPTRQHPEQVLTIDQRQTFFFTVFDGQRERQPLTVIQSYKWPSRN